MTVLFDAQNVKPEHKRSMAGFALRLKIMACLLRSSEAANTPALAVQVCLGSFSVKQGLKTETWLFSGY